MFAELIYNLKRPYHLLKTGLLDGFPAELRYRFPQKKLKILTITGTDGKTTSTTLLYHVLKTAGKKVGLISTVAAFLGKTELDTGFHVTAPQPSEVMKFMKEMVDLNYEYLVLEATSHGIYQSRTWGLKPLIAGLTNITHEHLDYHLSYENYVAAKTLLLRQARQVVLNSDDGSFNRVKRELRGSRAYIHEYSHQDVLSPKLRKAMIQRFPEAFNQMNARLVITMAKQLGVNDSVISEALLSFPGVTGRMQSIPNQRQLQIIVDFAHTPAALASALVTLRARTPRKNKVIAIFGCAGLRDHSKRPIMTKIASEIADVVILTSEDPRTEDVWSIIREMKEQLTDNHDKILTVIDRQTAISLALNQLAEPGDTVGIFGKGHEQSMCFGTIESHWSDGVAVKNSLRQRV